VRPLRRLLSTFKLPGEAQKIDRVVQAFADHWFASNRESREEPGEVPLNPFVNADGPYVLAFSIIMLSQAPFEGKPLFSIWHWMHFM
jgi:Sec7-like guanine-nucleotide exchange factor